MAYDPIRTALRAAVREAVRLGVGSTPRTMHERLDTAVDYAEALILPMVDAAVQQGIEDGFAQARACTPVNECAYGLGGCLGRRPVTRPEDSAGFARSDRHGEEGDRKPLASLVAE